jgi:hypothetical protein
MVEVERKAICDRSAMPMLNQQTAALPAPHSDRRTRNWSKARSSCAGRAPRSAHSRGRTPDRSALEARKEGKDDGAVTLARSASASPGPASRPWSESFERVCWPTTNAGRPIHDRRQVGPKRALGLQEPRDKPRSPSPTDAPNFGRLRRPICPTGGRRSKRRPRARRRVDEATRHGRRLPGCELRSSAHSRR